jgi:phage-related protein
MLHLSETIFTFEMEKKNKVRTVLFYKHYFEDFFIRQKSKVQEKIIWTFTLIEEIPRVPETYLKHIENTNGLYEIRIKIGSDAYRIFCFFDDGKLIVLVNGFHKKSQKTPRQEIETALKIKAEYESEKSLRNNK